MTPSFRQILPDLGAYRRELVGNGANFPLAEVPYRSAGLLSALPAPPAGCHGWPWDTQTPPFAASGVNWPKFTIVIPSFQQGDFIEEALRSVLLQGYPHLECIVMDGNSSDGTSGIIESYRPWLSYARAAKDRGQGHAINLGFSLGTGELFGWLNSDDFYLPGALRRVAETWMRTRCDFIYGDSLDLDQASRRYAHATAYLASGRYVRFPGLVPSHAAFWRATRHKPIWEEQSCALDYELWIRLLPGLRESHVSWPLGVFRQHSASKSFDTKAQGRWGEDARRNGLAHPGLYRPGLSSRLLAIEFRAVQRLCRTIRRRGLAARLEALRRECAWEEAPLADG